MSVGLAIALSSFAFKPFSNPVLAVLENPSNSQPDISQPDISQSDIIQPDISQFNPSGSYDSAVSSLATALADLDRFPLFLPASKGTLTAASDRLSLFQMSSPSLVLIQDNLGDRYGSDRLVEQWQAYRVNEQGLSGESFSTLNYVDVIVNQRIWNLLSYFERYAFILQFGLATKDYGYSLRVFHSGDVANFNDAITSGNAGNAAFITLRGAYVCPFDQRPSPPTSDPATALSCQVVFNSSSRRLSSN